MAKTVIDAGIKTNNGDLARLETKMLMPRFEPLFDTMDGDDTEAFEAHYRGLVAACNACHVATNHEYIRIAVPGEGAGRWNQRFLPTP